MLISVTAATAATAATAFSDAAPSPAQGERWMIEASLTCAAEWNAEPDR